MPIFFSLGEEHAWTNPHYCIDNNDNKALCGHSRGWLIQTSNDGTSLISLIKWINRDQVCFSGLQCSPHNFTSIVSLITSTFKARVTTASVCSLYARHMLEMDTRKTYNQLLDNTLMRYSSNFFEHKFSVDLLTNELGISLHTDL